MDTNTLTAVLTVCTTFVLIFIIIALIASCCKIKFSAVWTREDVDDNQPDDTAVDLFASAMKGKLATKREEGRGGWEDKSQCSGESLSQLLREHVEKGDPVDVANLAMMLWFRGELISPAGGTLPALEELRTAAYEMLEALVNEYPEGVRPRVMAAHRQLESAYDAATQRGGIKQ